MLKYAKPNAQFPFYGLRRLTELFSGERDHRMHNSDVLGSNRDNLGKSLPSPVSLIIPRGEYVSGHVVCPFASDTSPGELTEKAWENAVQGPGKGNPNRLERYGAHILSSC